MEKMNNDAATLLNLLNAAILKSPEGINVPIVVEDSEGECRPLVYAWYDKEQDMVRLSLEYTRFEDYDEE